MLNEKKNNGLWFLIHHSSFLGRCGRAALKLLAYEADEAVDLFRLEPIFEGGHAFAALCDLFGELFVSVFEGVPLLEARNVQLFATDFYGAALAVYLVAARAGLRVDGAHAGELICGLAGSIGGSGRRRGWRLGRIGVGCLVR